MNRPTTRHASSSSIRSRSARTSASFSKADRTCLTCASCCAGDRVLGWTRPSSFTKQSADLSSSTACVVAISSFGARLRFRCCVASRPLTSPMRAAQRRQKRKCASAVARSGRTITAASTGSRQAEHVRPSWRRIDMVTACEAFIVGPIFKTSWSFAGSRTRSALKTITYRRARCDPAETDGTLSAVCQGPRGCVRR